MTTSGITDTVLAETGPMGSEPILSRKIRLWCIVLIAIGAIALTGIAWDRFGPGDRPPQDSVKPIHASKRLSIVPVALTTQLDILGNVSAGRGVVIIAPFDGVIGEKKVSLGESVAAGDVLLKMDDGEIQARLREAQSALLKAAMAENDISHWDNGPEVTRARRALEAAQVTLTNLDRKVIETKGLLDRGIVSSDEYASLVQQRDSQKLLVAGAQQDLTVAAARGGAEGRRLAELDLEVAKAKFADVKKQADGATLRTPAAGVLMRPAPSGLPGAAPTVVELGSRVQRGQALFTVADMESLVVDGKVDEVDVNHVRVGQPVNIASDAFPGAPLSGRVISVSAEADRDASSKAAVFNVRAAITGGDDARRRSIRIGMSARLTITVQSKADAIVIPLGAVQRRSTGDWVTVEDMQTGETGDREIVLGSTTTTGVEVLSGLRTGDRLVIHR
ncbi:efflux RND transporter periplasmic adaptor subunit [Bradyrhizobium betae]|nr:HlyD family efflux transporter periplasmic adaptor subunit [Bradyrhizobium betae]